MIEILFEFLGEILLQLVLEILGEVGLRSLAAPFRREPQPLFAAIGYALFGAGAGGISLWLFPTLFIPSAAGRIAGLVLTPVVSGLVMAALGAWRRNRGQQLVRLDRFAYGYLFALALALVRWAFGH